MGATIGATSYGQRRYSSPPETGTLTTGQPSTWTLATDYTVDPTDGGINRVIDTNDGTARLYQCAVDHTSSAENRPSGTNNTAEWTYLGLAPTATTSAGALVLVLHAGRNDPMATPSDNDGGSFSSIDTFGYADFPEWGLGLFRRTTAANSKAGYAVSAPWIGIYVGSGAGDEQTLSFIEVRGVQVGAPSVHNHVERASPTSGKVASASYTLTVPSFVLSVWGGSGGVLDPGRSHVAVPLNDLVMIPSTNALMSISANGYVQYAGAYAVRGPGTYTEEWTSAEGAQVFVAAWPVLSNTVLVGSWARGWGRGWGR